MNPANMKKSELVSRLNFKCTHSHHGLSHPNCFDQEKGLSERVGYFDIEATNLKANFGYVLSYCIKRDGGDIIKRLISPKDIKNGTFDKNLMIQLMEDLKEFDRIVTYYGSGFDFPFVRTRCVYHGIPFPGYGSLKHSDAYMKLRGKVCLHSKRLGVVANFFGIAAKEHPIIPDVWMKCQAGDKKALDYVLTHNIEDVITTEKVWKKLKEFNRHTDTSI